MEKMQLPVEDLELDLANPRFKDRNLATQSEALKGLIGIGLPYFKTMMLSIKDHWLDPGDSFYVVASPDDADSFIVVDGNRRLAALKVLSEPAILQSTGLPDGQIKQLAEAAKGFDSKRADAVDCVLFDDRASANEWIVRRHGRDLVGEGRLTWGTLEKERFQGDATILDVIDFVERNSTKSDVEWAGVKTSVEANPSTLRRFLASKAGSEWLGLATKTEENGEKVPVFKRDPKHTLGVLESIFDSIHRGEINTRTYNKADDIKGYFDSLPKSLHPKGAPRKVATRFRDSEIKDAEIRPRLTKPLAATTPPTKTTRAKGPRMTLAEKRHAFSQPATVKGQRLVHEASRINARDFPLSSAYVLRAFLEHTIDIYMDAQGLDRFKGDKLLDLQKRAALVIDHLKANGTAYQKIRGADRVLTNTKDPSSIQALNDYHHDRYQIPAADSLRSAWDACVPLFIAVYGAAS